jgi:hypothetical protein
MQEVGVVVRTFLVELELEEQAVLVAVGTEDKTEPPQPQAVLIPEEVVALVVFKVTETYRVMLNLAVPVSSSSNTPFPVLQM